MLTWRFDAALILYMYFNCRFHASTDALRVSFQCTYIQTFIRVGNNKDKDKWR